MESSTGKELKNNENIKRQILDLDSVIKQYQDALKEIEKNNKKINKEILLELLIARDLVRAALEDIIKIDPKKLLIIHDSDRRFKNLANNINLKNELAELRESFHRPQEDWWWFLEAPVHLSDHLDWLWNGLTVAFIAGSISLSVEISARFLNGGLDWISSSVSIFQWVLTLLTAGGTLTDTGRKALEEVLLRWGVKRHHWQEIKLGLSFFLLLLFWTLYLCLPCLSKHFNTEGLKPYCARIVLIDQSKTKIPDICQELRINKIKYKKKGDKSQGNRNDSDNADEWATAQANYERAIGLNPNNAEAHYNLGRLYEDLRDIDKAKVEYRLALRSHLPAAYNALGRFLIQEAQYSKKTTKYHEAVSLFRRGLDIVSQDDRQTQAALRRNLGWAQLMQARYPDAEVNLREAIRLDDSGASAHCLLAQVLQKQGGAPQSTFLEWDVCLARAVSSYPEEDKWIGLAREYLDNRDN